MSQGSRADQKVMPFGSPSTGWPTFDKRGKVVKPVRAYIAGPMRGYENNNFAAFDLADTVLTAKGWDIINPAQLDREEGIEGDEFMPLGTPIFDLLRRDILAITSCDAIVFLPGWEASEGAKSEARVGFDIGLSFYKFNPSTGSVRKLSRNSVAAWSSPCE